MKLIVAIVNSDDSASVQEGLTEGGYFVTKLSTTGGFLKKGNTTFLIGTNDDKVDELNKKIEEQCLKFMAMESPVATDLRKIFTTSKIVTDLERMADYAVDICKIAQRVELDILGEECEPVWQMVDILRKMIKRSLEAFVTGNVKEAYEICKMDDEVDILYRGLFNDILKKMAKDETIINKGAQILFASKYLERVGDHVTNICEWIIFSSKGDYVDLNE